MTISPIPWTVRLSPDGTYAQILDRAGKIIGRFDDIRDADHIKELEKTVEDHEQTIKELEREVDELAQT